MAERVLDGHLGRPVAIDLCLTCQAFWFDARESLQLTPASTLTLFRVIGEDTKPGRPLAAARCPRCDARMHVAHDMQRQTRFEYLTCPVGHGRFTTFFNFLREKDFVKPLTPAQVAELRANFATVNCSNCGGAIDLASGGGCPHCGSPVSMLDLRQAATLIQQLQHADDRGPRANPALALSLARARVESEAAFGQLIDDPAWSRDASASGLVGAGLSLVARWLNTPV